jgi:16S rRNA (guanine1207-N2)-methyltransferase
MKPSSYTSKICFDIKLKDEQLKELTARYDGKEIPFFSYPGVFSYRKPDTGTMLLGRNLPETKPGKILDIGSGTGLLSLLAHARYPYTEIHAIDIDPRAVALSELNFQRSDNLTAWGSNLFETVMDRDYDLIISNIPAKPTKEVHTELIEGSFSHLKVGGSLYIVAAGRLKTYLLRIMKQSFGNSRKEGHNKTHTIVAATKEKLYPS